MSGFPKTISKNPFLEIWANTEAGREYFYISHLVIYINSGNYFRVHASAPANCVRAGKSPALITFKWIWVTQQERRTIEECKMWWHQACVSDICGWLHRLWIGWDDSQYIIVCSLGKNCILWFGNEFLHQVPKFESVFHWLMKMAGINFR